MGEFAGLEPDGALRLRLADGTVRVVHAGDVAIEGG
jgi:BirA family biotin operon repressor/biotin-[acetyl-CoA-carboxylase] ligase